MPTDREIILEIKKQLIAIGQNGLNIDNKHLIEYLTKQTFKYIPVAVSKIIVVVCSPAITLYIFSICSEGYGELKSDEHSGRERHCNFETISGKI